MGRLDGKVAFVTGGARGLGRAHALTLAAEGADVAVVDIASEAPATGYRLASRASLDDTAGEVQALGRRGLALVADVRSSRALQAAVEATLRQLGRIDILVANAGVGAAFTPAWEIAEDDWDTVVDIDLKGAWLSAKHVVPHMIERGSGKVIFIASQAGLKGYAGIASYCAAKFGVIGLMKSLAIELAPHGIIVNAICPGSVDTEGNRGVAEAMGVPFEQMVSAFTSKQLTPTVMSPEVIARAVVYLASSDGDFMIGHAMAIDGGATTK